MFSMTIGELIALAGGTNALARAAGVHHSTVCGWRDATGQVPVKRAIAISKVLDIPLHEIRPDIWAEPSSEDRVDTPSYV